MANIKIDVVSLDGIANVVLPDGSVYPLDQVTDIDTNSVIQVADNGEVTLLLDGNLVTLTSGQSLAISNFLSSQSDEPAPFFESESSIAEDSIDDLLAEFGEADTPTSTDSFAEALAGDGDLLENLEATAAGISDGGGGAEGGNNFVRVARIAEETNPAAFEFSQTTQDNQNDSFEPLDGVGENNALAEEPELTVSVAEFSATTQPTVTGETNQPAGTPVTVTFSDESGNVSSLEVIVDDNGNFSATAPDELSEGGFTVEAELADGLGNPVTAEQSGNIDVTAPELAVTPADSGTGNTPVISGQTDQPPGSDVTVTITDANGDTQVVTGEVADDGSFTVTAPELPEGDYTVEVTVVDAAGNTTTSTQSGTVDTTAPTFDVTPVDSGTGNTPVISGQTDQPPGSDVTVTITDANGDTQVVTGEVADDGTFTVTAPELPEGDYTVDVTVVDAAGNTTTSTQSGTVDTTAPTLNVTPVDSGTGNTPVISGQTDQPPGSDVTVTITDANGDTQVVTGEVADDGSFTVTAPELPEGDYTVDVTVVDAAGNTTTSTQSGTVDTTAPTLNVTPVDSGTGNTPVISGQTDQPPGSDVTVTITDANGDTQVVTGEVTDDGTFTVTAPELPEGDYTVDVTVVDAAGNTTTSTQSGTVDTTAPTLIVNDLGTGNDSTPTITGSGEVGAVVTVTVTDSLGNTQTIETVVDTDGNYSIDVPDALADGEYTVTVIAEDGAGNTSTQTVTAEVNSAAPTLTLDPSGLGNDATPTFTGTGEAGATVTLTITDANGTVQTVTTTVDGSGNFSVDVPIDLAEGSFTVDAASSDGSGNSASVSGSGSIDTIAPLLTVNDPGTGNDNTPTITGSGEVGAVVTVVVTDSLGNTQTIETVVDADGNYSIDVPDALADGEYTVTVTAEDVAGNTSTQTVTAEVNSAAPTLTLDPPGLGSDATPTLTGTGEAGATVTLTITDANGATQTVTTTVDGSGNFSVDVPTDLAEGNFTVSATTSDDAGNTASASGTGNVDTTAPVLSLNTLNDTNDTTPTLTGTGEAGATVTLTITDANGTSQTVTTTVDGAGNFSVDVPTDLAEGSFTVSATTSDDAGNTASASGTGNIDTTAPVLTLNNPGDTNDTTPTLTGTGEAGANVTLTITDANGTTQTVTTTVDGSGNFSVDVPTDLAEGSFTVSATTSDNAGNTASASGTGNIDTTAPVLTLTNPGETNDTTPTLTGNGEAGATVTLTITDANGATQTVTTTVDGSGNFSVDVPNDLAEGSFTVSATTSDTAGNTASASGTGNIDTTAPVLTLTNPGETNDTTPTLTGTGEAGATVTLTITDANGATQTVTTTVDGSGNFSVDVPTDLAEGNFTVSATTTDDAGNSASASGTGNIDTTPPVLTLTNPGETNDTTPTLTGTGEAGATVTLTITDANGSTQTVTTTVDGSGNFSVDVPSDLAEGSFTVSATTSDDAGNTASASGTGNIDTTAPVLTLNNPGDTNDTTPTLTGTGEAGATVTLTITDANGTTQTVTTTVDGSGNFSVDVPTDLAEGNFTVSATTTDDAGNSASTSGTGNIDTTAPVLTLNNPGETNDTTPTLTGTGEVGATVTLTITDANGTTQTVTTTVDGSGNFSVDVPTDLAEGSFTVSATTSDAAGNSASASGTGNIDTTAPVLTLTNPGETNDTTPTLTGTGEVGATVTLTITDANGTTQTVTTTVDGSGNFSVDVPTDLAEGSFTVSATTSDDAGNSASASGTGNIDTTAPVLTLTNPGETNDTTPTLTGTGEAGATVTLTITDANGTTQTVTTTVDGSGNFSVDVPTDLAEGSFTVSATTTDDAGNSASASGTGNIDTTAPVLTLTNPGETNDTTPTLTGTGEVGATVTLKITDANGATQTVTTTVDGSGNFSVDVPTDLAEGSFTVSATTTDDAGNSASASGTGNIDTTAPVLTLTNPGETNDTTPTLTGTGEVGATVTLTITDANGATQTVTTTVDGSGNFSVDVPTDLAEGSFTVSATTMDDAGNTASASGTGNIDTTAPVLTLTNPGETNDTTPTLTGTGEAGATVTLTITDANGSTQTVTTTVDGSGNFSVDVPSDLAEGSFTVSATTSDDAGNSASASGTGNIDTTAPVLTLTNPGETNDTTPTLTGTGEAGATVTLTITDANGTTQTVTTTVDGSGNFSVDVPTDLAEGSFTVSATTSDDAGNTASASGTGNIDTTAPVLTLTDPGETNDTTPTLTGTGEAGATVTLTITDANGATQTVTTTVDGSGNFSVDVPTDLAEGNFTVSATTSDDAGNTASVSGTGNIDTTAPVISINDPGVGSDATPTITGSTDASAGSTVSLSVTDDNGVTQNFSATVASDGTYSADVPSDLAEGNYTVSATVSDSAGNSASASATGEVNSNAPLLTIDPPGILGDATPLISGTTDVAVGTTVTIVVTDALGVSQTFFTTVQADLTYSASVPAILAEGGFNIAVSVTNGVGVTASVSTSGTIDTVDPVISLDVVGTTNVDTPVISGTCDEIGATVNISVVDGDGTTHTVSATVQSDGTFSVTMPSALPEGLLTVNATVLDDAGNLATASTSGLIDLTLPTLSLASIGDINNDTPVISGTCDEIGATVNISVVDGDGTTHTVSATVQPDGTFSVTMPNALPEGLLTVNATVLDDAGNLATASTSGLIDLTLPTLSLASIGDINNDTPVISGTCDEIGATVNISVVDGDGTTHTVSATVQPDGTFSVTMPSALPEGLLTVNATVLDDAGNLATASTSGLIDLTLPTLSLASIGDINNDTPVISGTCDEIGATVNISVVDGDGTTHTVSATVQSDGTFSVTMPSALPEGLLTVNATVLDDAGNLATASTSGLIDLTLPTLSLTSIGDINNDTPVISGTCDEIGATVNISVVDGDGTTHTVSATVQSDGTFSVTMPSALPEGLLTVNATVLDDAGNLATASTSGLIDLTLPTLSLASIGDINNDTPVISGTCDEIGATVNISVVDGDGTTHTVSATVQSDGTFSVTMPSALPEGLLTVNATVLDDAGNLTTASTSGLIDLTLPTLSLASIGDINNDTPVISGTCDEIGATVSISVVDGDGTTHTVSATVQSDGTFSVTMPSALPEGLLTVNATVLDDAGNLATASTSGLIDLTLPTLSLASIGDINNDTPVISGTCDEIGATVNISVVDGDGTTHTVSATVQSDGTFSVTMPSALPEGLLTVNATVLDDAGNLATASTSGLIDLTLPTLSLASIGDINNDTPVISGTCDEIGATVNISVVDGDGTTHTVSATVQSDGTFSVTMPSALPEGLLTVNATVLDDAGNLATASTSGLIDLTLPTLSLASIGDINNDTPVISGTCDEIGATVNISVVDGDGTTHTVSATVQSDGTFSVTMPSALPEGLLTVNATVLDDAGNLATASTSGLIDLTLPTLSLASIGDINNDTPVISGTCDEIGATVNISVVDGDGTTHTVSATVQSDGTFSVTMPSALPEGLLTVNATVLDDAGNLATASTSGLIDLTLPTLSLASIGSINNDTPVISGTCDEIGATVSISVVDGDGTTHTVSATVQSDGTFSVTMPSALPEGLLTVNATVLDDAGNLATASTSGLIDLTLPTLSLASIGNINNDTPVISGTCDEIGATVNISVVDGDGTTHTVSATVQSDGTFSVTMPSALPEGLLTVNATVLDDAGNLATASTSGLIDLTLPTLSLASIGSINNDTPVISGTCDEIGATVSISVVDGDGTTHTVSATVQSDGTFSVTMPSALPEGLLTVNATVLDDAGNLATAGTSGLIDLTVPLFNLDSLGSINDTTPTISGTSDEIGATVSITTTDDDGSIQTFDTTVGSDGNFSIDIPLDVAEGVLNVSASVSDDAGNVSSDSIIGLIDITAPSLALTALPTLLSPIVSGTTDTDMVGRTINVDVTADIGGINQTVSLSTTVLADGSWSTGPIASLGVGPVSVSVYIADEAGNIATESQSGTVSLSSGGSGSPLLGTDSASDSAQSDADAKLLNLINDLNKPTDI